MADAQARILAPGPRLGRYLTFSLKAGAKPHQTLLQLKDIIAGDQLVVGIGLRQIIRCIRGAIKKNGRGGGRRHGRAV